MLALEDDTQHTLFLQPRIPIVAKSFWKEMRQHVQPDFATVKYLSRVRNRVCTDRVLEHGGILLVGFPSHVKIVCFQS